MEELNLGDLDFDTSGIQLFDEGAEIKEEKPTGDNPDETGNTKPDVNIGDDDTKDPGGDDSAFADQESVANRDKDNDQVQAGKTADGDEGGDSSSPKLNETEQLYSNLAAEFKAKGVLPELDINKIKSLSDIQDAIKDQINSGLTDKQRLIEEAQGVGAPVSEVAQKVNTIDKLKAVSPEFLRNENNIEFRRTAITQDALNKGYSKERAAVMAQRSIDAGTDIEDADFALRSVIKHEENSLNGIIQDARDAEQGRLSDLKKHISSTPEVLPGISLTDTQKDELYNQITSDLGNKENAFMQAQKSDPVGSRVKLEAIFMLTKGLTDFSIFGNKAETKISNNIENLLRGASFTQEGTVDTDVSDSNSNFKLADLKNLEIE